MRAWLLAGLAALALGCRTVPATQVLVFFHAEDDLAAEAASIRVRVDTDEGNALDRTDALSREGVTHLARVPLVPRDGDASRRFRVEGALLDASGEVLVEVSAVAGYVTHERRELHLWLDRECVGIEPCDDGRTCQLGVCTGECFEPSPVGATARSQPLCGECETCTSGVCAPRRDGSSCGCEGDVCEDGACRAAVRVQNVFAGELHTCATTAPDGLYCWGSDRAGQTSIGEQRAVPTRLAANLWSVGSCGTDFTCVLGVFGERQCWGWNDAGQIGDGTMREEVVGPTETLEPALDLIDSGWNHTCGIGEDGRLYCWGGNRNGEVGEQDIGGGVATPRLLAPDDRFLQIATGGFHDCALRTDGRILCWGLNESGEVGTGDFLDRTAPTEVGCIDGECDGWTSIAAGDFHSCAIRGEGELWCWGGGQNGQLGTGPMLLANVATPVGPIEGGPYALAAGGGSHTCAITSSGALACWGRNDFGQIGVGSTDQINRPASVVVPGRGGFRALGLGRDHTCAIRTDETLWCWGRNTEDQLGLGEVEGDRVTTPRRVCFLPP
ncbi:RCC1 domain-containing protein [Sandaracinus amylolyticus]|uniref:RCC1 domain-containing protein n=1 Tax=Sandaracinus amylolyticus TaxID=927083 RepID=UPI001F3E9A37|nr:hypothetical protein [Sandaracinus amylolyticus]UJR79339.1 Hypothetical protein I5071_13750 [Sandaracinus amylolyticus]